MKMHALSGGRLRMRRSIYVPGAARAETIELPVSAFLMRHPQGNVLFDSGCHPAVAEDAEARWGGMAKVMTPVAPPSDNVIQGLGRIGLAPGDVDVVVCSHLHSDHCGCNGFFGKATVICHAAELAAARAPDAVQMGYLAVDWEPATPFREIEGQHDVFGDARIVLVPVPGHTPGTVAALVNLDRDGSFLLASDAASLRATLEREVVPRNTWDTDRALASLAEIRRIAAAGATVLFGHDDEQWRTLRKGEDAYE
ncbi:N-acyl homoserine lactonase AttM [Methylobacterium crusticola]|uniref:N-acyl homoserine lactonase AttM n=1 Tax=Methylobacterium crusticola TaxID=1697972 RepID=A0ABQ4R674_9HYPH|nr:N-acyl homoserine lactonase family protein [Methylobacterium crusticola]GJD53148.1 N-acyl homoserine lactonase AttM [Methylobacterium crusticola]